MFSIVRLNHLFDFDDELKDIYQMKHRYKPQEENQNRVTTNSTYTKRSRFNLNNYLIRFGSIIDTFIGTTIKWWNSMKI